MASNTTAPIGLTAARGEPDASLWATLLAPLSTLFERLHKASSERRLREKLSELDDNLLVDIGIQPDEIHLIRARHSFTPRDWERRMHANPNALR